MDELTVEVGIVVPVLNNWHFTEQLLHGLMMTHGNFGVCIVDNGSQDETCIRLAHYGIDPRYKFLSCIMNHENRGYGPSLNQGFKKLAGCDYYVAMNNDIRVLSPDWLNDLVAPLRHNPLRLVGHRLIDFNDATIVDEVRVVYLEGYLLAMHHSLLAATGGFDEELGPVFFEDAFLSAQAQALGCELISLPDLGIHHYYGQTTYARTPHSQIETWTRLNKARFITKIRDLRNGSL